MAGFADQQVHVPGKTAEYGEVTEGGGNVLVRAVLKEHGQLPLGIICRGIRNGKTETGIAAPVAARFLSVYEDAALLVGALKGKEGPLPARLPPERGFVYRQPLPGILFFEPGVGQCDRGPFPLRELRGNIAYGQAGEFSELPALIQGKFLHCCFLSGFRRFGPVPGQGTGGESGTFISSFCRAERFSGIRRGTVR